MQRRALTFGAAAMALLAMGVCLGARGRTAAQSPAAPLPAPRTGTGAISGHSIEAGTSNPASDAVVTLTGRGMAPQRAVVDPRGAFEFADLPSGPFTVTASKPGYIGGGAGGTYATHPGWPVDLADGQRVGDLALKLWKYGVVTGTATGDAGEAVAGVEIDALRRTLAGGRWMLAPAAVGVTDDRGRYRIGGLSPGDYAIVARPAADPDTPLLLTLVSANPETGLDILAGVMTTARKGPALDPSVRNYPMTFFAGAPPALRLTLVPVDWDRERASVDFHLKQTRVVRVSGALSGANGPVEGVTIRLLPVDADGNYAPLEAASAACESDGRFEFSAVTAGRYILSVLEVPAQTAGGPAGAPLPAGPTWWANMPLMVGAVNVADVNVPLHKGATVAGHLEFHGAAAAPPPDQIGQIAMRLDRVDRSVPGATGTWRGTIDSDGHFHTVGVPPGNYLVRVTTPPRGWTLQSALSAGSDALDVPLTIGPADMSDMVISFSDRAAATLTGAVRDAQNVEVSDVAVLAFPTDRRLWTDAGAPARRFKLAYPSKTGVYAVGGLPAGEYFVASMSGRVPADWQDPKVLDGLAITAARTRVESGESRTLDLKAGKR